MHPLFFPRPPPLLRRTLRGGTLCLSASRSFHLIIMRHRLSVLPLRLADDACFSAAGGLEFGCKDTNYFSIHQIKFLLFFFFCTDYQLYILKKRRCMDAGELYFLFFRWRFSQFQDSPFPLVFYHCNDETRPFLSGRVGLAVWGRVRTCSSHPPSSCCSRILQYAKPTRCSGNGPIGVPQTRQCV